MNNPALEAFLAEFESELVLAQVLISRCGGGFSLRHVSDKDRPAQSLRPLSIADLRALAQFTEKGAFRPLKSAPNLKSGWMATLGNASELAFALDCLYPGAIADRYATGRIAPTDYRAFTNRQSGMYRITQLLSDTQAAEVIRACCHVRFCLKQRLWTVAGLSPDGREEKSLVPCLEPCAVFLEFARSATRLTQADKIQPALTSEDVRTIEDGLDKQDVAMREADFSDSRNPRLLQLTLEKLQSSSASTVKQP